MPPSAKETSQQALVLGYSNDAAGLNKLLSRTPAAWKSEVFFEVLHVPTLSRACLDVLFRHGLTPFTQLGPHMFFPMHILALEGNVDGCRYLVEQRRADIEDRDGFGRTALMDAVLGGHTEIVRYLLDRGADCDVVDSTGKTPLYAAAQDGNMNAVRLLLDLGASEGPYPSICGAATEGHTAILALLLSKGRDINATDLDGWSALDCAIYQDHTETVSFLLDRGAFFRTHHGEAGVPILAAALCGRTAILRLLLDRGLPVLSIRNNNGLTCLHAAAHGYQVETLRFLLDRGMEVDVRANDGLTPFHSAIMLGAVECVHLLLERGASLEAHFIASSDALPAVTPLILAANCCTTRAAGVNPANRLAVFKLLLDHVNRSEDPRRLLLMPTSTGRTALVHSVRGNATFELRVRAQLLLPHLRMIPAEGPIGSLEGFDPTAFEFYSLTRILVVLGDRKKTPLSPAQWSSALVRLLDLFPSDLRPFECEYDAIFVEALVNTTRSLRHRLHSLLPSRSGKGWTGNRLAWFKAGRVVQRRMEAVLRRATGRACCSTFL